MTELSDDLLVAYVDRQLARGQASAVEKVLRRDGVIAERVEILKLAHARLEAAFEAILAEEVRDLEASASLLPPPPRPQHGDRLAKLGFFVVAVGALLGALVAGLGWPF